MTLAKKIEKRRRATMKGSKGNLSQHPVRNLHAPRKAKLDGDGWEYFYKQAMQKFAAEERSRLRHILYVMGRSLQAIRPEALQKFDNNPMKFTNYLMENSEHIIPTVSAYSAITGDPEFARAARYLTSQTTGLENIDEVNDALKIEGLDLLGSLAVVGTPIKGLTRQAAEWGPNAYAIHYTLDQVSGGKAREYIAEAIEPHVDKLEAHINVHESQAKLNNALMSGAGEEEIEGLRSQLRNNRERLIVEKSQGFAPDYETTAKEVSAMRELGLDGTKLLAESFAIGLSPIQYPWIRFGLEHSGLGPTAIQRTRTEAEARARNVSDPGVEGQTLLRGIPGTPYRPGDTVTPEIRSELQQKGVETIAVVPPESTAERSARLGAEISSTIAESAVGMNALRRARAAAKAAPRGSSRLFTAAGKAGRGAAAFGKALAKYSPLIRGVIGGAEGYHAMKPGAREQVSQRIADIYREERDLPWYERAGRAARDIGEGVTGLGDPQQARARLAAMWGAPGPEGKSREEILQELERTENFREMTAQAASDVTDIMPGIDPIRAEWMGATIALNRLRIAEGERAGPGYVADPALRARIEGMSSEELQTELTEAERQAYHTHAFDEALPHILEGHHPYDVTTIENARRLLHQMGPAAFSRMFLDAVDEQIVPTRHALGKQLLRPSGNIPTGTIVTPEIQQKLRSEGVEGVVAATYYPNRELMTYLQEGSKTPEGESNLLPYRVDPEKRPLVARFTDRTEQPLRHRMEQQRERAHKIRRRRWRELGRAHQKELRERERAQRSAETERRLSEMDREFEEEYQRWEQARRRQDRQQQEAMDLRHAQQSKLTQRVLDWSRGRRSPTRRPTIPAGVARAEIAQHLQRKGQLTPGTRRAISEARHLPPAGPQQQKALPQTRLSDYRGQFEPPSVDVQGSTAQNVFADAGPLDLVEHGP